MKWITDILSFQASRSTSGKNIIIRVPTTILITMIRGGVIPSFGDLISISTDIIRTEERFV